MKVLPCSCVITRPMWSAPAHQVGGLLDDAAAVIGRLRLPQLETGLRGSERGVQIRGRRVGQVSERFLRRGIDDVLAAAAIAVFPLAVDVEPELRVHGMSSPLAFLWEWGLKLCPNE